MLTEKEKQWLREELPVDRVSVADSEMVVASQDILTERSDFLELKLGELEKFDLFLEGLNKYFLVKDRIEKSGISEEELREFTGLVNQHKVNVTALDSMAQASIIAIHEVSEKCPDCGRPLVLRAITKPKGRHNLYGWKSSQYCNCGYETFSEIPFEVRARDLRDRATPIRLKIHREIASARPHIGLVPKLLVCPKCNKMMQLLPINIPKGRENRYGWRSVLSCAYCGHENFSKKPYKKRLNRIKREIENGSCK